MFVIIKLRYRSVNLYGKIWLNTSCSCWLLLIGREYSCMLGNERKKESMCIQKLVPCTSLCFKTNEVWECRATYLLVCVNCCMCRHLGKIHLRCMFGQNTSYLDNDKSQENLHNASHVDRWNAKTKKFNWDASHFHFKFNWEAETLQKKKLHQVRNWRASVYFFSSSSLRIKPNWSVNPSTLNFKSCTS